MVISLVKPGSGTSKTLAHAAALNPLGGKRYRQAGPDEKQASQDPADCPVKNIRRA